MRLRQCTILLFIALVVFMVSQCKDSPLADTSVSLYRNHSDSATYAGIDACKQCHADKYETFIRTGMGQSFGLATKAKSAGKFQEHQAIYDSYNNLWYYPHFDNNQLYITEFRKEGKDTVYKRSELIKYIIGSGHHTNSHLYEVNGYIYQAPLTFYTQARKWDLPPGFEKGHNSRFSRIIGNECMSCHNSFPVYEEGSENRFSTVPGGIGCERCHGPGSIHVAEKYKGIRVDTKKEIDYTIVNPAKLSWERQIDVCQRCHLQGNSVLKPAKNWPDFRPGMVLSDYMDIYMPKIIGNDDHFIMASHAQRLQMSACFVKSNAHGSHDNKLPLTCINCHNPHVSVRETGTEIFNDACKKCHGGNDQKACTENMSRRNAVNDQCWKCHMPKNGTDDIPHVTVTDHFIRKVKRGVPTTSKNKDQFGGLGCINNPFPTDYSKATAYLNAFEKSDNRQHTLDSADFYIHKLTGDEKAVLNARLYFLMEDYEKVAQVSSISKPDAWTCYRIGKSFMKTNRLEEACSWLGKAVKQAQGNLEFRLEWATALTLAGKQTEAAEIYKKVIEVNPRLAKAHCNLAYIYKIQGNLTAAESEALVALAMDPDYVNAIEHLLDIYLKQHEPDKVRYWMKRLKKLVPNHPALAAFQG